MKRVVIAGATGVIGMALIQKCMQESMEIVILIRSDSSRKLQIPQHPLIKVVTCDLGNMCTLSLDDDEKCDVFYYFAWMGTYGYNRNNLDLQIKNVEYTVQAVDLAKRLGCHTFIGAGSQAEYGRVNAKLDSLTSANPESGYGMAKLCAGQMSRLRCNQLGLKHIWTRILSVYGPYDAEYTMVMSTINKLLQGITPALTKGEQVWDYIYSADVAEALIRLGKSEISGKTYCIGSGTPDLLRNYIYKIRDAINPQLELGLGEVPYSSEQNMYLCADISELEQDIGFVPQTSFECGIQHTIEWARTNK